MAITKILNKMINKKRLSSLITIVVFIILYTQIDLIRKTSFYNEVVFVLYSVFLIWYLKEYYTENKFIKLGKFLKVKGQLDNLNLYFSIIIGFTIIFLLVFDIFKLETILENLTFLSIGILLIISALKNRKSILLKKKGDSILRISNIEINVKSENLEILFSNYQISFIIENIEIKKINEIILDFNEAKKIADWINVNFKPSSIEYFWNNENNIKERLTATNTV